MLASWPKPPLTASKNRQIELSHLKRFHRTFALNNPTTSIERAQPASFSRNQP